MVSLVTKGIKITVQTQYSPALSKADTRHFLFTYKICIENKSEYTIQLLRRKWHIFDSIGEHRTVEGEGVVGQQPVIAPNETFIYESACNLLSDIGTMSGTYQFMRIMDKEKFYAEIPEFRMVAPQRLN